MNNLYLRYVDLPMHYRIVDTESSFDSSWLFRSVWHLHLKWMSDFHESQSQACTFCLRHIMHSFISQKSSRHDWCGTFIRALFSHNLFAIIFLFLRIHRGRIFTRCNIHKRVCLHFIEIKYGFTLMCSASALSNFKFKFLSIFVNHYFLRKCAFPEKSFTRRISRVKFD